jgi:intracellular sulfur oxidation DsrE/DsrF family protein
MTVKPAILVALVLSLGAAFAVRGLAADPMTDPPPPGYYVTQKVVYQNDGGPPDDHAYFQRLMRHLNAHLEATGGKVEIRVVNFATGVTMLQMAKTDPALASSIDALRAKGVRFMVCRNTMRGMKITPADLYNVKPDDVVPAGVAELARLQGQGWVYIHP